MIQINRENNVKIQVLDDELLLASFSDAEAAEEYARASEMKLRRTNLTNGLTPGAFSNRASI